MAAVAAAAARTAGIHVDESAAKGFVKMMEGEMMFFNQMLLERLDTGGSTDGPTWKLMALASERYPSSLLTDTLVGYLAHFQRHDGSWWFGGISRAPFEEGSMARTAMAIRGHAGLRHAGHEGGSRRPHRARHNYLANAKAATNDEAAMQILGLAWAGGNAAKMSALGKALTARSTPTAAGARIAICRAMPTRRGVALRAERGGRSGGVRCGLSKGREVSDGHAMRGRLLVCAQPCA